MSEQEGVTVAAGWDDAGAATALRSFEALAEAVDVGVFQLDERERVVAANDAFRDRLGYDGDGLVGEHVSTLLGEGEIDRLEATLDAADDGEATLELLVRTADGTAIQTDLKLRRVRVDGERRGAVAVVREFGPEPGDGRDRPFERRTTELEAELSEVFGRISDGFFALDESFRFTHVNERAQELINPEGRDLVGESVWEAFPEATGRAFREQYERAMDRQVPVSFEEYYPDPLDAWFEVRAYPSETGLSVYFRDVTERKARESELERYETLFTESRDVNAVVNPDGTFQYLPPSTEHVLGYEPEDLVGETAFEYVHPEDRERVFEAFSELVEDPDSEPTLEFRYEHADGSWVVLEARGRNLLEDPDIGGIVAYTHDITERTEHEAELAERERELSALMDNVPGMVYRCWNERGWPMEFVSDACRDLTGYDPETIERGEVGWGEDVIIEGDREDVWKEIQATATDQGPFSVSYRIETADGDVRWVSDYGRGIFDDGELVGVEGIVSDVTERKRLESELDEVFGRVTDAFYALDDQWRITHANERAEELIDYQGEGLVGKDMWEVFEWGADSKLGREYREAMATQEPTSFEIYYPDPLASWFEVDAYPSETGLSVYFRDVTERKERERELEESEWRYRTLAEYFPNGIVTLFDEDLEYTLAAGQGFEFIPVEPDDLEGERFRDVWDADTAAALAPAFEAALDGEERSVELSYAGREWILHAVPIADEDGDVFAGVTMAQDITERKERERELAKYETIVETVDDGIYVKDDEGYFTMVNDAYAELTGYDREELVGAHASMVVDEDAIQESRKIESADRDEDAALEAPIQRKDGETVPTEGTFATLSTGDGSEKRVGVVRDITERKEQQRRIEESERRYRTLVEHFPNGAVGLFDEDLRYTVVGGDALEAIDASADDIVGQTLWERYPDEVAETLEPKFRAALDGEASDFEWEFHGRHWTAYTVPVSDDGDISGGMIMVQDITDRKRMEEDLRESEAKFRTLAENLDDIVWMSTTDPEEFLYVNPAYEDVFGRDREDLYDEPLSFADAVHPDDRERVLDRFLDLPESEFDEEFRIVRPDGEVRWIYARAVPVRDEDGEVFRVVGISEDVTGLKEREQRLEELVEKLEASNERLEQFAYAASHDLQEPLRMVTSYLSLIEQRYEDELDAEGREFLEFAVDGADRMREMIDALLEYSRVETRGDPFDEVDLQDVFADATTDLQMKIDERDARITVGSLPTVRGDDHQLRQVFQNLLGNAIEYSGEDPPRIDVWAERTGGEWTISVRDEGIGIEQEHTDRIFEVFQRLHTHDEHAGTGIGLALCQRIVERHGGEIWVESEPGEGSTFYFTLPAEGEYV